VSGLYSDLLSAAEAHGFVSNEAKDLLEQAAAMIENDPRGEAEEADSKDAPKMFRVVFSAETDYCDIEARTPAEARERAESLLAQDIENDQAPEAAWAFDHVDGQDHETSASKGRTVALEALAVLMDRHEDVSLDAIFHDREGRDLDDDSETLYLVGRATAAVEVADLDLAALIAEVQPNAPDTPKTCAGCDNGEALNPGEECGDCGNAGAPCGNSGEED